MRATRILLGTLIGIVPMAAGAQNVPHGQSLAEHWCAKCHVVSAAATSGQSNGLPTFPGLAARTDITPDKLKAAMTAQHGRMPDFQLGARDQDDLVAYIMSLKKN